MKPLWCFDFSENSESQISALGFPFDIDENIMFMNLMSIDDGVIAIKNHRRYNNSEKYQRTLVGAIGKNPDLKIVIKTIKKDDCYR